MKTFLVDKGTLEQINWIAYGERDRLIEEFLMHTYTRPTKAPGELKRRSGEKEQLAVNLSNEALLKLESYALAAGDKVKRSHIFKDMMTQFILHVQPDNQAITETLKNELFEKIRELNNFMAASEIQEEIAAYLANYQ